MTDQDNLRDRIAELIDPNAWRMYRIPEMPGWPESTEVIEPSREKAQAIIDEFGMTVDDGTAWVDAPAGPIPVPAVRVVGKWEKQ